MSAKCQKRTLRPWLGMHRPPSGYPRSDGRSPSLTARVSHAFASKGANQTTRPAFQFKRSQYNFISVEKIRHGDPVEHGAVALQQIVHAPVFFSLEVDAHMRAELAAVHHDGVADRLALGVVGFQRGVDVVVMTESCLLYTSPSPRD